ncbi:hypothetical protein TRFO_21468 [Tritrichomonas foetus]|uniref:Uncharacterized protein n=1 Tax=Tritrichomonas foetus TaxID=1144522 RepID=A0A1J4KDS5_9EUKA|nr:hypothetical protein TRFO_21468 [Tritrichomonas foetus]|eukprot:OHT09585.1 hypothetical protein TRFO_21468 [Tritrichomonas foetus]
MEVLEANKKLLQISVNTDTAKEIILFLYTEVTRLAKEIGFLNQQYNDMIKNDRLSKLSQHVDEINNETNKKLENFAATISSLVKTNSEHQTMMREQLEQSNHNLNKSINENVSRLERMINPLINIPFKIEDIQRRLENGFDNDSVSELLSSRSDSFEFEGKDLRSSRKPKKNDSKVGKKRKSSSLASKVDENRKSNNNLNFSNDNVNNAYISDNNQNNNQQNIENDENENNINYNNNQNQINNHNNNNQNQINNHNNNNQNQINISNDKNNNGNNSYNLQKENNSRSNSNNDNLSSVTGLSKVGKDSYANKKTTATANENSSTSSNMNSNPNSNMNSETENQSKPSSRGNSKEESRTVVFDDKGKPILPSLTGKNFSTRKNPLSGRSSKIYDRLNRNPKSSSNNKNNIENHSNPHSKNVNDVNNDDRSGRDVDDDGQEDEVQKKKVKSSKDLNVQRSSKNSNGLRAHTSFVYSPRQTRPLHNNYNHNDQNYYTTNPNGHVVSSRDSGCDDCDFHSSRSNHDLENELATLKDILEKQTQQLVSISGYSGAPIEDVINNIVNIREKEINTANQARMQQMYNEFQNAISEIRHEMNVTNHKLENVATIKDLLSLTNENVLQDVGSTAIGQKPCYCLACGRPKNAGVSNYSMFLDSSTQDMLNYSPLSKTPPKPASAKVKLLLSEGNSPFRKTAPSSLKKPNTIENGEKSPIA